MRCVAAVCLVGVVLVAASAASSAGGSIVRPVLKGTCTEKNKVDKNDVMISSTLTCTTKAICECSERTALVYESVWTSPGTGASGREKGTITATGKNATVMLELSGTRDGSGASSGKWVLGKVTGQPRADFRSQGTYRAMVKTLDPDASPTTSVRIAAAISCWSC
jgi:hypothetical protein